MTQVIFKNKRYDEGTINVNIRDPTELLTNVKVTIVHVLWVVKMHQFSLKSGLKLFGTKGENDDTK